MSNIFDDIRDGKAPADIVFKNEYVTAFKDINPSAPVHILIIPNKKMVTLKDAGDDDGMYLSQILLVAKELAKQFGIEDSGYRLITNSGKDGSQEIDYLHFHLVGGVKLGRMISLPKDSKKIFKMLNDKANG